MDATPPQSAAAGADILSSAIQACQECEKSRADWCVFTSSLEEENRQLSAALEVLEGRARDIKDIREKQERMISAQADLIITLKSEVADMQQEPLSPGDFLSVNSVLPVEDLESRLPSPSPSEGYAATLLMEHARANA
ncbi:hypothetical protein LEL_10568 [Akanthomyces lecanii RCEF 1005]|uniref:Uncharacterized protein n=1 Tax=Akanthomyces lecanii RCEF 1005 TaxID=1081108 RepID=A0A167XLH2_CORDF|nr:hypothetical protein LEL_10568 [Akanthomyces lecanii RCEF 1005]